MSFVRFLVISALSLLAHGLAGQTPTLVVTSNPLLEDIVRTLAGDAVEVRCLLPAGVRYGEYEPGPDDARMLAGAALLIVNGIELEPSLEQLADDAGFSGQVVVAGEGFPLLNTEGELQDPDTEPGSDQGVPDPYAWLDPRNMRTYVQSVALALSDLIPARASTVDAQLRAYLTELDTAHAYAEQQFAALTGARRVLATSLDFLGYLAYAYQFKLVMVPGPGAGLQPDAAPARMLADGYRMLGYPAIFVPADAGSRTLRFIAQESDVAMVTGLSEGPATGETYLRVFRTNVDAIAKALDPSDTPSAWHPEPLNPIAVDNPVSNEAPERE